MEKLKGKIIYPEDSQPKYVNSAFGGISGNEFVVNFVYEYDEFPKSFSIVKIDEDSLMQEFEMPKNAKVKKVEASLVMSKESALSIYKWLDSCLKDGGFDDVE